MPFSKTPAAIARALAERKYDTATPVQAAILEADAQDRDLLVSAQTGSGKTVAYGLAIAETLLEGAETLGRPGKPLGLIIAPTRELAMQVQRELNWLYQYAGARIVACVGGMDPMRERRQLSDGVHIVVGTPGRLRDHIERRALDLAGLKAVVLDEADEMLDLGFRDDLQFILENTPEERRTLLFSATLPKPIVALARDYQRDALRIQTVSETSGHADIEYRVIRVPHHLNESAVVNLLRFLDPPSALVFCATRQSVRHMEAMLKERGFSAVALSGELSQHERNTALQALRDGRAKVCVATDVAARGIDLPNLGLVIHADLPNDASVLQHRSGRTGRAGKKGVSILLVANARRRKAEEMLRNAGVEYSWSNPPTAEDIRALDRQRLLENPILSEEQNEDDLGMAEQLLAAHDPRAVAAAFVKLYRAQFPAPEDIIEAYEPRGEKRERGERRERRDRDDRPRRGEGGIHSSDYDPRQDSRQDRPQGPNRRERRAAMQNRDADASISNDGASRPPRGERGPKDRGPRAEMQNGVWFKVTVGRERKADPKWLLPEICRQGEITKKDIGAIRVYDTETRFEVDPMVAAKFAELVTARAKGGVRIFAAPDGEPPPRRDTSTEAYEKRPPRESSEEGDRPKRHFGKKPHNGKGFGKSIGGKPFAGKSGGDKPPFRKGKNKNKGKPKRD